MVSIQTYTPTSLSRYIKSFWYLKISEDLIAPYVEEILPDGHPEIIFHLDSSPARKRAGSEDWQNDPNIFFAGQNKKSYTQRLSPGAIIYGIRFHPHTQALLYDFPASLSTDILISFPDITVNDTLSGCIDESPTKTFANFEKEITRTITRIKKPATNFLYVDVAVQKIIQQKGNMKMEMLEKITGVTARHLEKSFQQFVGLSPKQFSNITRYTYFINYRKDHPGKTLTDCAYEAEFYDQSHLIYLSNQITGQSPKSYFGKINYINDVFLKA